MNVANCFYSIKLFTLSFLLLISGTLHTHAQEPDVIELHYDDRAIQVWHWQPTSKTVGTILFSHGAGSAPWKYTPLVTQWLDNGYQVFGPLHVDSTDHPHHDRYTGFASWTTRLQDMQILADTYGGESYIAAGHSYGGLTALVKGGAVALIPDGVPVPVADNRVKLVLAFSPPGAIPGFIEKQGYSKLAVPALIQTGTADVPIGSAAGWQTHLDAYQAVERGGNRYALVLDDVDHYFGGLICRPELPGPHQTAQMQEALRISTLMLKAYAENDSAAKLTLSEQLGKHGQANLESR